MGEERKEVERREKRKQEARYLLCFTCSCGNHSFSSITGTSRCPQYFQRLLLKIDTKALAGVVQPPTTLIKEKRKSHGWGTDKLKGRHSGDAVEDEGTLSAEASSGDTPKQILSTMGSCHGLSLHPHLSGHPAWGFMPLSTSPPDGLLPGQQRSQWYSSPRCLNLLL